MPTLYNLCLSPLLTKLSGRNPSWTIKIVPGQVRAIKTAIKVIFNMRRDRQRTIRQDLQLLEFFLNVFPFRMMKNNLKHFRSINSWDFLSTSCPKKKCIQCLENIADISQAQNKQRPSIGFTFSASGYLSVSLSVYRLWLITKISEGSRGQPWTRDGGMSHFRPQKEFTIRHQSQ